MSKTKLSLLSLAIGSLPHRDAVAACRLLLDTLNIPNWPQLPRRSFLENMYVQFSERFPGVIVADERIYVNRERDLDPELERLYIAYLTEDLEYATISPEYAAGLHHFLESDLGGPAVVKGQVTGPVSWGLTVLDQNRRPVLYEEILAEAIAKHLRLKATWMERKLCQVADKTILIVDEPYMSAFGSAFVPINRDQVITLMEEVLAGIEGLKGVHCCGNTDWSLMLSTTADILSLDAYDYAESLALYPDEVAAFIGRGGMIAWGIVPSSDQAWAETVESLLVRFHQAVGLLTAKGIDQDDLLAASLITPSCGCGSLKVETAERVMALTAGVAKALQERYG